MLVPPPTPLYTLAPSIEDLEQATHDLIERCVASLTGHLGSVIVTAVRVTSRHRIVELITTDGPVSVMELVEN
jgi:hypothetical protein